MCCWTTKPRSVVAAARRDVFSAVSSQHLAEQWQRVNNMNSSSSVQTHELCPLPWHLCPKESDKYEDYCEHGVCCVIITEEHCSCYKGFAGARCDENFLDHYLNRSTSMSRFVGAVSAASAVAIIVVILLIVLLVLFYLRVRYRRMEQQKQVKLQQQQEVTVKVSQTCTVEPGFSWREASVKRQSRKSLSCKSPSDNSRPLSLSASDITALEDTTPLTPLVPLSPLKSPSNRRTLLNQPTFVKLQ
jgi:uncharacterized membrane protein YciS (DUF1049 family)